MEELKAQEEVKTVADQKELASFMEESSPEPADLGKNVSSKTNDVDVALLMPHLSPET